jgi:hypothetical protein
VHQSLTKVFELTEQITKENSKRITKALEGRAETLENFVSVQEGLSETSDSVRKLAGKPDASEGKSKLVELGTTMILFPDPTPVGDVVGLAMITAGLLDKKYRKKPLSIYDAKIEFAETWKELQELRQLVP